MNVDIFALYIFSPYSRLTNIRENIYIVKITFIMPHRGSNIKNAKINLRKITNFQKSAKIYIHEIIYIHSMYGKSHMPGHIYDWMWRGFLGAMHIVGGQRFYLYMG